MVLKRPFIIFKFWESLSRSAILEPQSDNESESQSDESESQFFAGFEPRRTDRSTLINPNSTTDESESQSDFMANQSGSQSSDESESHANNDFLTSPFGSGSESSKGQIILEQIGAVLKFSKKATKVAMISALACKMGQIK